eukprot:TRINITY_DN15246_c0_g1_i2.p1 TRINITY_DN15246_c0_g1~~TRINITY_DN15246_c0_g1_i2.p1  ORF type:complete len:187 (+),score=34.28 TRINITY_DN15246_c0_g1_i2:143-703(+)
MEARGKCINCSKGYSLPVKYSIPLCPQCSQHQISYFKAIEDKAPYDPPDQIEAHLWLGSYRSASNKRNLLALNIKNILTVGDHMKQKFTDSFKYLQVLIDDDEDEYILGVLPKLVKFVEDSVERKEGVLVHCLGGVSRSATVVTAYIMKSRKLSMKKALKFVKEKRSCISPNRGFLDQLEKYADLI